MQQSRHQGRVKIIAVVLWSLFLGYAAVSLAQSLWPEDEQRLNVGIKLFPACLGADLALADKLDADGELRVLVVHDQNPAHADSTVRQLRQLGKIAGYPLRVASTALSVLERQANEHIAALFIVSPGLPEQLFSDWVQNHQTLVFSPFAGDVERGAVAGVFVSDRILPLINNAAAARAGIRFKPFFLRIAEQL